MPIMNVDAMWKFGAEQLRLSLAEPTGKLARMWPSQLNLSLMRWLYKIQLGPEQIHLIMATIRRKPGCRLLIFGLGNDSQFWAALNKEGTTVFLEDNKPWFDKIAKKFPYLRAFQVTYGTRRTEWRSLLVNPSLLPMALPNEIQQSEWDVILVDSPKGWRDQDPGRMKSIYVASQLIKRSGDIFVHDCEREVEDVYCRYFLKDQNMKMEIPHPEGWLRHYHMADSLAQAN
jgi:hypothetical protein